MSHEENQASNPYEQIADRFWNQPQKGSEERDRELLFIDDIIQKHHIERELEALVLKTPGGLRTAFDGGAGAGRFSLFLARMGLHVTHFDISDSMLETAADAAAREGISDRIRFVKGRLGDLSAFGDNAFDLVLSVDAPISYTWPEHRTVIGDLVRMARKHVLFSVSSRLGSLPYLLNPIQKMQYLMDQDSSDPLVQWYTTHAQSALDSFTPDWQGIGAFLNTGLMDDPDEILNSWAQGDTPWPVTYHFLPEELEGILRGEGLENIRMSGPGALSRSIPNEILTKLVQDDAHRKAFLELCHRFDGRASVAGLGKDNLLAVADKNARA